MSACVHACVHVSVRRRPFVAQLPYRQLPSKSPPPAAPLFPALLPALVSPRGRPIAASKDNLWSAVQPTLSHQSQGNAVQSTTATITASGNQRPVQWFVTKPAQGLVQHSVQEPLQRSAGVRMFSCAKDITGWRKPGDPSSSSEIQGLRTENLARLAETHDDKACWI